jgi:toxin-antitoxin system PIN domain toxin
VSFAVDVNILLYAPDADSPRGTQASAFLADRASGSELFCLAWPTVVSYLRIATHSAIFAAPLSPAEAMHNVGALLELPQVRVLAEQDGFWAVYQQVAAAAPVRGNLVPDAHLAALLRQHGVRTLYTAEAGFRRFRFLDVLDRFES